MTHNIDNPTTRQETQLLACRQFYTFAPLIPLRVVDEHPALAPLERTRLYGPFPVEVVMWFNRVMLPGMKFGHDVDGREYVEY